MTNPYRKGTDLFDKVKARQLLDDMIKGGTFIMDHRAGCDGEGCKGSEVSFQIFLNEGEGYSEDHYCLDCLLKDLESQIKNKNKKT